MIDQQKELEMFNAHQEDTRKRTEFLAKSVFLISGGALSLSMSLFLGDKAPKISPELICYVRIAWWALFFSMLGFVLVFGVMLIRDYCFGESWRSHLYGNKKTDIQNTPKAYDYMMWIIGSVSTLCFLLGMGFLAWASTSLIGRPVG